MNRAFHSQVRRRPRWVGRLPLHVALAAIVLLGGCTTTTLIPPSALPLLNSASTRVVQGAGAGAGQLNYTRETLITVPTVDGDELEVRGSFRASLLLADGERLRLRQPMYAIVEFDSLIVTTLTITERPIPLREISELRISQTDHVTSALVALAVALLVVGGIVFLSAGGL